MFSIQSDLSTPSQSQKSREKSLSLGKHDLVVSVTDNIFPGLILPLSLATAIFRLMPEYSSSLPDLGYLEFHPLLCSLLSYLELTWITLLDYGTMVAVIFRSATK